MPRSTREKSRSGIYHLILWEINKQNIFEDNEDRQKFVDTLEYYKTISNYMLCGQCLYKEQLNLSDNEVMDHLRELEIATISALQRLKKEERDDIIKKMKDMQGVTIRQ